MVHHHVRRPHNRRQDEDGGIPVPTGAGLTAASIAAGGQATEASLAINTAVAGANTAQDVEFSSSATNTISTPAAAATEASDATTASPSPSAASAASSSDISMGTVIGACLGALVGAILIILIGLWLYKRGTQPRRRSPSSAHRMDKERAWAKMDDDEDKWEGKDGAGKYQQKGVVSVGPMEKLTMFKTATPSMHTNSPSMENDKTLPTVAPFAHPFAQYHPNLAKELAQDDSASAVEPPQRPFLARVDPIAPISWDGDTLGRDSFLSLSSNNGNNGNAAISPAVDMAIPTPKLTSSEPHLWQSAVVMDFDPSSDDTGRGRTSVAEDTDTERRRKSSNNPFFGARMSVHSTHSTRSRSQSRSRTPSISGGIAPSVVPDPETMPQPPASAYTREEKGKYRAVTPPSPAGSRAPSTIIAHAGTINPFSDPADTEADADHPITPIVPFKAEHVSKDSQDRAIASLLAALGPTANMQDVQERLRVASMNPSVISESQYTETDGETATLHQSWPVPPSRP